MAWTLSPPLSLTRHGVLPSLLSRSGLWHLAAKPEIGRQLCHIAAGHQSNEASAPEGASWCMRSRHMRTPNLGTTLLRQAWRLNFVISFEMPHQRFSICDGSSEGREEVVCMIMFALSISSTLLPPPSRTLSLPLMRAPSRYRRFVPRPLPAAEASTQSPVRQHAVMRAGSVQSCGKCGAFSCGRAEKQLSASTGVPAICHATCRQGQLRQYCFVFEGTMASFLPISTLHWATLGPRIGPSSAQHDKLHSGSLRTCPHLSPSSSSRRGAVCGAAWCSGHWPCELRKCTSIET